MKKCVSLLLVIALFGTLLVPGIGLFGSVLVQAESAAPVPNAFQMKIGEDGTVSNGVDSTTYRLSSTAVLPETKTDSVSGEKYISFNTADDAYYEVSMRPTSGQTGFFWDAFWHRRGETRDVSFTWEFIVMLPEMPATHSQIFGYYTDDKSGGFGFQANATKGILALGNGYGSTDYDTTSSVFFEFDMQADIWYHCILTYDHASKMAMAFVNGTNLTVDSETSVSVAQIAGAHYLWDKNEMCIGTTSYGDSKGVVNVDNNIAAYNFSTYSVTAEQAKMLYVNAMGSWTQAPTPNAFLMNIANDGTVSNGLVSNIYRLSGTDSKPDVYADSVTGSPYLSFNTTDNAYYEVSMRPENGQQIGYFWDAFWHRQGRDGYDPSFTWEFTVMLPEMPDVFAQVFGYFTDDESGGFGFQANATQGILILGNGYKDSGYGTNASIRFKFDMQADTWYHCILTYDHASKTAMAFVNGESIAVDEETAVYVEEFAGAHYLWDKNELCIGTTSYGDSVGAVCFDNNISLYNFSTYSVNELEAGALYKQYQKSWDSYVDIQSAAPELSESITLHCTAMVSAKSYSDVKMVFDFKGEKIEVTGSNEGACYTFALPDILPQDLGETISMSLYAGDTLLDSYENYSIKTYCMNMLNSTTDEESELRVLLVALLNYGSQAQNYFGSDLSSLANSELTEVQKNYLPVYNIDDAVSVESLLTGAANNDYVWKAATLSLQDRLQIRLRFTATDIENVRILLGGNTFTYEDFIPAGNNTWFVYSDGIAAHSYGEVITAMFVDASGDQITNTQTVHYSINTYVKYVSGLGYVAETELVKSIYSYGLSAKAYHAIQ